MCFHLHFLDNTEPVHVNQKLSVLGVHLVPDIYEAHLHNFEFLVALLQVGVSLRLMLLLDALYFLLVFLN